MECTKCHKVLATDDFSYKNLAKKIYYLHCNNCREKLKKQTNKKKAEKEQYESVKEKNVIQCDCGKVYVAFRDYHIFRHQNSKYHLSMI